MQFEDVTRLVVILFILVLPYIFWFLVRHYRVLGNPTLDKKKPPARLPPQNPLLERLGNAFHIIGHEIYWVIRPTIWKVLLAILVVMLIVGGYVAHYFLTRPYVVFQYPLEDMPWNDANTPITIVFDKPIKKDELQFNISTETPGELIWIPSFPGLPDNVQLYRELQFFPDRTLLPDQEIVVYVVGIQNLTSTNGIHESALDFASPELPEVKGMSVEHEQIEVAIDTEIAIELTAPNGNFIEWEYEISPEIIHEIKSVSPEIQKIEFPNKLEQSTTYQITTKRALVEKVLETGEIINRFDFETVDSRSFDTIKTPFIDTITPTGTSVKPDSHISITFDMAMDEQSVLDNISIEPEIEGEYSWQEDHLTLIFTPANPFAKDTEYTVRIGEDASSISGGKTLKQLEHKFTTLGAVKVTKINPANSTVDVDPSSAISFKFDQEVDKESAQSKFSTNPSLNGSFEWDGNTLIFRPSGLNYSSTYTATVAEGVKSKYGDNSKKSYSTTFTTRSETFVLDVPWYPQQESFTCNIASTRMVLAYKGVNLAEADIKNTIGAQPVYSGSTGGNPHEGFVDGYGTYWTAISSFISTHRSNNIKQGWNLTDMLQEVRNGNPSIIWWHNQWSDWYWKEWTTPDSSTMSGLNGMHSEVVIGYTGSISNPSTVITRDPWRGTRYYPASTFRDVWSRSFNNTAVVVY